MVLTFCNHKKFLVDPIKYLVDSIKLFVDLNKSKYLVDSAKKFISINKNLLNLPNFLGYPTR